MKKHTLKVRTAIKAGPGPGESHTQYAAVAGGVDRAAPASSDGAGVARGPGGGA